MLPHDSQLTQPKPPQVVKRLATIMPSAAIYTHLRTDFTGTVAAMAELAANPDVPRIDIPSEVFSSALLKCMCNEIQTYLFNKEFGYYDQAEEAAKESKRKRAERTKRTKIEKPGSRATARTVEIEVEFEDAATRRTSESVAMGRGRRRGRGRGDEGGF